LKGRDAVKGGRSDDSGEVRARPAWLRALGHEEPPVGVEIGGRWFMRREVLKHDSWAATALYEGTGGKVICKFNRRQSLSGLPMGWLGRLLGQREARALRRLAGVAAVPAEVGPVVVGGRVQRNAVAHVYVEGRALRHKDRVGDAFFGELRDAVDAVHARGMAYVDLNKAENILLDLEGRPHLIDFQIHFALPGWWPGNWVMWGLLKILQGSDDYHLLKHIHRMRPDQMPGGRTIDEMRPWWIRGWRWLSTPFQRARRALLVRVKVRSGKGMAETEVAGP
jgi:hypothetical protein